MNAERASDRAFIITVVAAFFAKLWLTSETRIVPLYALYDASSFVVHATNIALGQWFGRYDQFTLMKQPFFPIYMAGVQEFGIPLPIAHLMLYGLACCVACFAVKPIVRSPFLLSAMFLVLYFNPVEADIYSWYTTRSQVNPSVTILTVFCAIGLYLRRGAPSGTKLRWAAALGLSWGAFWLTREEAVWILFPLALLLAAFLYAPVRERNLPELRSRALTAAVPVALWAAVIGTVMLLNGVYYGWYTTAENVSPELGSAWNSLARIDTGKPAMRSVPVPRAALSAAYRISPAARELEPALDGAIGDFWVSSWCQQPGCTEMNTNFIWALRGAVSQAGHYTSGAAARAFYLRLAGEIDAACDAHRITCRPKRHSLAPPVGLTDIPRIASNAVAGMLLAVTFGDLRFEPNHDPSSPNVRADYDFVARSVDDGFPYEAAGKDDDFKRAALYDIGHAYGFAIPVWLLLTLVAVVARCVAILRGRSARARLDYLLVSASLAVGFLSLTGLFAVLAAVAFPTFYPDYMSPLYPLLLAAICIVTAVEGPILMRDRGKWLPSRKATA